MRKESLLILLAILTSVYYDTSAYNYLIILLILISKTMSYVGPCIIHRTAMAII